MRCLEADSTSAEQVCAVAAPAGTGLTLPTLSADGALAANSMAALTEAVAAVEAAVRTAATSGLPTSYPPLPRFVGLINNAALHLVVAQRSLQHQQQHSAQASPAAEGPKQLQVWLRLLLLSCLKALRAADGDPCRNTPPSELHALATAQVHNVSTELLMWSHSTSNSSCLLSSLHMLLMSRQFCTTGQLLQQLAQAPLGTADAASSAQLHVAGSNGGSSTADTKGLQCELQTCGVMIFSLSGMLRDLPLQSIGADGAPAAGTQTTPALLSASSAPSSSSSSTTTAASSCTTLQALESQRQQLHDNLVGLLTLMATASSSNLLSTENIRVLTSSPAEAAAVPDVTSIMQQAGLLQEVTIESVRQLLQEIGSAPDAEGAGTPLSVCSLATADPEHLQLGPRLTLLGQLQVTLLGQLQERLGAVEALQAESSTAGMLEVGQQLVAFGTALCAALPSNHCCNNAACTNLALTQRFSESLVGGKGCVCGG
jgi:hypothetical protein